MFKHITKDERLQQAEAENRMLRAQLAEQSATTAYVAMMADVDLPKKETNQTEMAGERDEQDV